MHNAEVNNILPVSESYKSNLLLVSLKWLIMLIICGIVFSCSKNDENTDFKNLNNLPKDTGGIHLAVPYDEQINAYGYYIYTPSNYGRDEAVYPLLVFLHGAGEKGNSMTDPSVLKKVLVNGPPKLINAKKWMPRYPMIVVSPQCHESWWNPVKVHKLIAMILKNYHINTDRIYITGLSMGGYGTYSYIEAYGDSSYAAAAIPICGAGNTSKGAAYANTPLWAFHGDADNTVPTVNSINMVKAINDKSPKVRAKVTIYPGVGHDSWSRTYDGTGMGTEKKEYDPFDIAVYDWLFKYTKLK